MKQMVTDIQDIRAALDDEDAQLMRMFPRRREAALDEMLLVQKDGKMFLLRKADVARRRKVIRGIAMTACALFGVSCLVFSIVSAVQGVGNPWVFLACFEVNMVPLLMKIPGPVNGGC